MNVNRATLVASGLRPRVNQGNLTIKVNLRKTVHYGFLLYMEI
jgi:hypothetical protein